MPSVLDPRMVVAYPLDETGATQVRKSVGPLVHDLTPQNDTGTQGVIAASDDVSGRAVNLLDAITRLTTTKRRLVGASAVWQAHPLFVALPRSVGATGLAYGARIQFKNAKPTSSQRIIGFSESATVGGHLGLVFVANAASPIRGRLSIVLPDRTLESVTAAAWTDTDGLVAAHTADYIQQNTWWRAVVRYNFAAGVTYVIQVVLFNELTGVRYRLTRAALATDYSAPTSSVRFEIGSRSSTQESFQGYVDDAWLLNGDLSEETAVDVVSGGLAVSREDDNTYRGRPKIIVDALWDDSAGVEHATAPVFMSDMLLARMPSKAGAEAFSLRTRAYAPGRPMVLKWMKSIYIQKAGSRGSVR